LDSGGFRAALLLLDLQHADKPPEDAALPDRGLMMWRAFSSEARIALGLCSHGRFVDKAEALRFLLGKDGSWCFLVGMDAMARILDPRFYEDPERDIRALFHQNGFVVFRRGGRWETVRRQMERWRKEGARIREAELPETVRGVSSSQLRRRRARGLPLGPGVSPAVSRFIVRTGLYSTDPRRVSRYEKRKGRWMQMSRPVPLAPPIER
jgi:nicotinamide-nucleotide adenylyltransferase